MFRNLELTHVPLAEEGDVLQPGHSQVGGGVGFSCDLGALRQLLDVDSGQGGGKRTFGLDDRRKHDRGDDRRALRGRIAVLPDIADSAQNVVNRDAPALAAELVAPARSPQSAQNTIVNKGLENRLEMAWRQAVPTRDRPGGNWTITSVEGHINNRSNGV
jgi:hypothetical protein